MPPAKKPKWTQRRQRAVATDGLEDREEQVVPEPAPTITALQRKQLYARLLWLDDYRAIFAAEAAMQAPLLEQLTTAYTSTYARRLMASGTTQGAVASQAVSMRLSSCIGMLDRSANRLHVPIEQAAKAIAFLAAGVEKPVWEAERKARRVVGRTYAKELLEEMVECRPPPPFQEQDRAIISSIGFDQTYAKAGGGTGGSKYNGIQTVDAHGAPVSVERMVYINGQFFPAPQNRTALSDGAVARITAAGPYTQDFRRILPLLEPDRLERVMDAYVRRAVGLLQSRPSSTREGMARLLSRPNDNPGSATYLTFMPPLPWVNTASYVDMIRIVEWCVTFLACTPIILHLIGDGQSVLRLRDLKRQHPARYKHVLIGNGHFHSGAHSGFADITLWWWSIICTCMLTIGKVEANRDGTYTGTVRPGIKSLEGNSVEHTQQALLAVTVAIMIFFTTKVTSPPPELFLSDPIAYLARIENATGIVLYEFLRHSGLPTLMWQRGTRGREGVTLDDLHCLALHKFRLAHKTSSSQISLLHLISIYGTHPELRTYLRDRLFVSLTPNIGAAVGTDKSLECMNEVQKERHVGASLIQSLSFTRLIQPMLYAYRQWKIAMGTLAASSTGVRPSMENEIDALVRLFETKAGPDLETYTTHNTLWYTGTPVNMRTAANLKRGRVWQWLRRHADGMSTGFQPQSADGGSSDTRASRETWFQWVLRHIREHMFHQ